MALLLYTMTLTAFLLASTRGILTVRNATREVIAQNLAQEAIELVRAKRDYNFINQGELLVESWHDGILENCDGQFGCSVDPRIEVAEDDFIHQCVVPDCGVIMLDDEGFYRDVNRGLDPDFNDSGFRREIRVEELSSFGADKAISVEVTLRWKNGRADREFTMREVLTDWYDDTI